MALPSVRRDAGCDRTTAFIHGPRVTTRPGRIEPGLDEARPSRHAATGLQVRRWPAPGDREAIAPELGAGDREGLRVPGNAG